MTLTIGVNSYGTIVEADAYFTEQGKIVEWSAVGDDSVKEGLLHQAFEYMGLRYDAGWKGNRTTLSQQIAWPRTGVSIYDNIQIDVNTIPEPIKHAQFKLSLLLHTTDLLPLQNNNSLIEKRIGPITKKWNSAKGATAGIVDVPEVALLLRPYIRSNANTGQGSGIVPITIGC